MQIEKLSLDGIGENKFSINLTVPNQNFLAAT